MGEPGRRGAQGQAGSGRVRGQGIAGTWPTGRPAQAGGFLPGLEALSPLADRLRAWVRAEAGAGRLLPWIPVTYGSGIALYFAADHEPVLAVACVTAIAFCLAAFLLRRSATLPRPCCSRR